jgi:purine nucleosidase
MRETIRSRPGEVTLLAVGPFTNVAALFASDPETATLLKRLVIMGGVYLPTSGRTEWNATCDPHATAIMFSAVLKDLTAYGLDVTLKCKLPADECRQRLRGGALDLVADMAEVWFANTTKSGHARPRETITFHDPLAAVGIFHPEVCSYERGWITVETVSETLGGMTTFNTAPSAPREIAVDVDRDRFFEEYFGVFA